MATIIQRIKNSLNYRVRGIPSVAQPPPDRRTLWEKRRDEHDRHILESASPYRHFEMLREVASSSSNTANRSKVLPLLSYALAFRPTRMVELGCSFSFYPDTYPGGSPWLASTHEHEGVFSTKTLLVACRVLNKLGIAASLTSVDIREGGPNDQIGNPDFEWVRQTSFENAKQLLSDLDLAQYWKPVMGTDSISWLKSQKEPIDLCLVDSQHTYAQVHGELEALLPVMNPNGLIIVDDWSDIDYKPGVDWNTDDDEYGVARGGEFGAVLEFLEKHAEWQAEWWPSASVPLVFLSQRNAVRAAK